MNTQNERPAPRILSMQSQLVYGCAGNNAALPLLQALGATVYAVPTVLLSNTPHYKTVALHEIPAPVVEELLLRTLERVPATELDGILIGYIRDPEIITVIAAAIDQIRQINPSVVVLIDPVMGDLDLGLYVPDEVSKRICTDLIPRADICTPNVFEAGVITGSGGQPTELILSHLSRLNVPVVLATGIGLDNAGAPVGTRLWQADGGQRKSWVVSTPHIAIRPTGTGDLLSAAFLHAFLTQESAPESLCTSVAMVRDLLEDAARCRLPELQPWKIRQLLAASDSQPRLSAIALS